MLLPLSAALLLDVFMGGSLPSLALVSGWLCGCPLATMGTNVSIYAAITPFLLVTGFIRLVSRGQFVLPYPPLIRCSLCSYSGLLSLKIRPTRKSMKRVLSWLVKLPEPSRLLPRLLVKRVVSKSTATAWKFPFSDRIAPQ